MLASAYEWRRARLSHFRGASALSGDIRCLVVRLRGARRSAAHSDLDVALLFRTRGATVLDNYELLGRIAAQLEAVAPGRLIDLVSIEAQGPVFQHRILSEGRLVHDVDPPRRVDFESDVYVRYFDFAPIHERAKRFAVAGFVNWLESHE